MAGHQIPIGVAVIHRALAMEATPGVIEAPVQAKVPGQGATAQVHPLVAQGQAPVAPDLHLHLQDHVVGN